MMSFIFIREYISRMNPGYMGLCLHLCIG